MGNAAQVILNSGADQTAFQLVANFNQQGVSYGYPVRFCSRVVLVSGMSPSYAFIGMPCKEFPADEEAFNIALKKGGPAGSILLRSRCAISYSEGPGQSVNLLNGNLIKYGHNIDEDSLVGEVYDDRWIMGKITVFGRYVWDPEADICYFDASSPLVFNKMGYPDLLDHPQYGPVFAPSFKFGWRTGSYEQSAESNPGSASSATRSWRVQDANLYFRNFYGNQSFKGAFRNSQLDYGTTTLPNFIKWDASACVFEGSDRTLKDVNVNNESLLSALQALARKAGAIDLYMKPLPGLMSSLVFLNMNPKTNTGSRLFLPDYAGGSIADFMNAGDICQSGYVGESVINQFDDTAICGDSATVERYCSTQAGGSFTVGGSRTLEPADTNDFLLFIQYIIDNQGAKGSDAQEAFESASLIWPAALASFRIGRGAPVFSGTKWSDHSLGCRFPRMKPAQLTAYNNGDQNPRNFQPREIVVEYRMTPNEIELAKNNPTWNRVEWMPAQRYDNLALNPDSTILYLTALRDAKQTWRSEGNIVVVEGKNVEKFPDGYKGEYDGNFIYRRDIRLNVAIESDWVITGRDKTDPNNVAPRIDQSAPKFTWLSVSQPLDYVDYTRVNSRPNGDAQIQEPWKTQNYPDRASLGNELFSDISSGRLPDHSTKRQADVNRIDYSGELFVARMNPSLIPGLPLSVEGSATIPTFAVVKCSVFDANAQGVTVQFGPPDSKEIYDTPGKYSGGSAPLGGGSFSKKPKIESGGSGGYKTPGKDEETGGKSNTQETTTTGGKSNSEADDYKDDPTGHGGTDVKKQVKTGNDEKTERGPIKTTSDEKKSSSPGSETNYSWGVAPDKNPKQGAAAKGQAAKDARAQAKSAHDARHPGIGEDGLGFGKASNGMNQAAGRAGPKANIGHDFGLGNPSSGSMTPGARGGSHRNWDTNKTRDGDKAAGQMPDHSKYDLNNKSNPMWAKKNPTVAKAQEKADQFKGGNAGEPSGNPLGNLLKKPKTSPGNAPGFKKDENGFDIPGSNK